MSHADHDVEPEAFHELVGWLTNDWDGPVGTVDPRILGVIDGMSEEPARRMMTRIFAALAADGYSVTRAG